MQLDIDTQLLIAKNEIGDYRKSADREEKEHRFEYALSLFRHTPYPPGSFIGVFDLVLACCKEAGLELTIIES